MTRIPVYQPDLSGNEKEYVLRCIETSWISSIGEYIEQFEKEFASYVGSKHAISVCNGTVALHLALHCLGIGANDEVIVPSFTYIASVNTIAQTGAKPIFAESSDSDWNIDPADIERRITTKTRAIMPVHMYGAPCNMEEISLIAKRHRLLLIEDCAEALGSRIAGRHVGYCSDVAAYSFFGNKTVTTGEGGMVTTNDDDLALLIRKTRGQGQSFEKRYWHDILGFNYRMTNIAAAIGLAQMERVDSILEQKRAISLKYRQALSRAPVTFQDIKDRTTPSHWLVSVLLPEGVNRDRIIEELSARDIETRPTFYCAHEMPMYCMEDKGSEQYPNAKSLSQRGICLPSWPGLTDQNIRRISENLDDVLARNLG